MCTDPPFRFGEAFDPEATNAMAAAVEDICEALGINADARRDREVIAARVVRRATPTPWQPSSAQYSRHSASDSS